MNYTKKVILSLVLFQIILLLFVTVWSSKLDIVLGVIVLLVTFLFVERTLILLIFYVSVLPTVAWASHLPFVPFIIRMEIVFVFVLLALFYVVMQKMLQGKLEIGFTAMDKVFFFFLIVVGCSWLRGYLNDNPRGFLRGEFFYLASYSVYFAVANSKMDERWNNRFLRIVTLSSLIASIEYIGAVIRHPALVRVSTRLAHSAQLSLPYLMMLLLSLKGWKKKSLCIVCLLLILSMVLVSLQRGIWIGVFVSWSVILVWYLLKLSSPGIHSYAVRISILLILGVLVSSLFVGRVLNYRAEHIVERMQTLSALWSDPSLFIRFDECAQAMSRVKNIWIGNGLGDFIFQRIRGVRANFVDNSYFFFVWKMGLVGLLAYLGIVFVFLKRCLFVYRKSPDDELRYFAIVAFSSFVGLQFLAQATACVAVYEFNPVWAILIGTVEMNARRLEKG